MWVRSLVSTQFWKAASAARRRVADYCPAGGCQKRLSDLVRRYDDKLENLLAVQKRVAEAILLSLRVKLDRGEVAVRGPANQEQVGVYELYLQGRYHSGKRNVEALRKTRVSPRSATRDAGFAPAHAGLADSYALLG